MDYKGYAIKRGKDGNYTVTPPNAMKWRDPAANLETAKRWVEQHIAERRNRFAPAKVEAKKSWSIDVSIRGDRRHLGTLEGTWQELREALGQTFQIEREDDLSGDIVITRRP